MINVKEIGSFSVGGRRVTLSGLPSYEARVAVNAPARVVDPNGDFWAGQMYVQYVRLTESISRFPILLWHGGGLSGSCWETTPDGREGWQMLFLQAGYDVYVSDAVERGRASWARYPEIYPAEPIFRPYKHAWESFRIGPKYDSNPDARETYPGSQYPKEAFEAAMMQAVPRWSCNDQLAQQAYEAYLQKVGPSIIIVHSQGCAFAAQAALHHPDLVKALVFLEPSGMPTVQDAELAKIKNIPQLYVWGDYLDEFQTWQKNGVGDSYYKTVKKYYDRLSSISTVTAWIELPEIGIKGNTHMMIHDRNSADIATLVQKWLKENIAD